MHILENVEPDLAKQLRKWTSQQARRALIKACEFVSSKIMLDAELSELIAQWRSNNSPTEDTCQSLNSYVEAADERYFELQENGAEEDEWMPWFQKARFATALVKTSKSSDWDDIADGIYELTVIFKDSSVVEFLKRCLTEVQA